MRGGQRPGQLEADRDAGPVGVDVERLEQCPERLGLHGSTLAHHPQLDPGPDSAYLQAPVARPRAGRRRVPEVAQDPAQQRGVDDHVDRAAQPAYRVEVVQLRGQRRDRHELRGEREPAEQQLGHQLDVEGALREPLEGGVQPVQRLTGLVCRHVAVGEHRDPALGHREWSAHLVGERREEPVPLLGPPPRPAGP